MTGLINETTDILHLTLSMLYYMLSIYEYNLAISLVVGISTKVRTSWNSRWTLQSIFQHVLSQRDKDKHSKTISTAKLATAQIVLLINKTESQFERPRMNGNCAMASWSSSLGLARKMPHKWVRQHKCATFLKYFPTYLYRGITKW